MVNGFREICIFLHKKVQGTPLSRQLVVDSVEGHVDHTHHREFNENLTAIAHFTSKCLWKVYGIV